MLLSYKASEQLAITLDRLHSNPYRGDVWRPVRCICRARPKTRRNMVFFEDCAVVEPICQYLAGENRASVGRPRFIGCAVVNKNAIVGESGMIWRYSLAILTAVLTWTPSASFGQWKPAPVSISTPWADDVDPDHTLPSYPRPQLVREQWDCLNGLWEFAITKLDAEKPKVWDGQILVPFALESSLSGVGRYLAHGEHLWYRRDFNASTPNNGQRLLLHFGAVDWEATVFVNGRKVGAHRGGYDPFSFDITEALGDGDTHELVVRVYDPTRTGFGPTGKQKDPPGGVMYTPVSGVWQTVWTELVPAKHISSFRAETLPDRSGWTIYVDAEGGQAIPFTLTVASQAAEGVTGKPLQITLDQPRLWSPDDPHLYDLTIELENGDSIESYAALRTVEVCTNDLGYESLCLNGQPLFQYGPLDQGWWPDGLYTAPTDEALRWDVEKMKELGFNMVRKHVKVEPARWYFFCDNLGLLVWQDIPNSFNLRSAEGKANFEHETMEMVNDLRCFPSIVMWVPWNEGWGQEGYGLKASRKLVDNIRKIDPTRLLNSGSGWFNVGGDHLVDHHFYAGPLVQRLPKDRAYVLGEFGGLRTDFAGHVWQEGNEKPKSHYRDEQAFREKFVHVLWRANVLRAMGLSAACYTQLTDVEIELNGYYTYDRKVSKLGDEFYREMHEKILADPPKVTMFAGGETLEWEIESSQGTVRSAMGPFGVEHRNVMVNTKWQGEPITLSRTFDYHGEGDGENADVQLWALAGRDTNLRITVNGQSVEEVQGGGPMFYRSASLVDQQLLHEGKNVVEIQARASRGNRTPVFDVRLFALSDGWVRPGVAAGNHDQIDEEAEAAANMLQSVSDIDSRN